MKANFNEKTMSAILSISTESYKGFSKVDDLKPLLKSVAKLWEQGLRVASATTDERANAMYERYCERVAEVVNIAGTDVELSALDYVVFYSLMGIRFGTSKGESALRYTAEGTFKKGVMDYLLKSYMGEAAITLKEKDVDRLSGNKRNGKNGKVKVYAPSNEEILKAQNASIEEKAALMDKWLAEYSARIAA